MRLVTIKDVLVLAIVVGGLVTKLSGLDSQRTTLPVFPVKFIVVPLPEQTIAATGVLVPATVGGI